MQTPTTDDLIKALRAQQVAEKYIAEGVSIILNHMDRKDSTIEEAIIFLKKWIAINES